MKKNVVILFITIVIIIGVIVFLESKKRNTSVVLETGESIETGILKSSELTGKNIGDRAPNWKLQSFDGELIELAAFRGGPVMIDFFADWCPFCHEEFPFIEAAHQTYSDRLTVIGIHRTDTESKAIGEAFARGEAGATFTLVKDSGGDVYGAYTSGPAMPISFFIDESGIIQDKVLGPKSEIRLKEAIETIIQKL